VAFIVGPIAVVLGYIPWWITSPHSAALRLAFAFWYAVLATGILNLLLRAWRNGRRTSEQDVEEPDE
jgi:hypothetical protein